MSKILFVGEFNGRETQFSVHRWTQREGGTAVRVYVNYPDKSGRICSGDVQLLEGPAGFKAHPLKQLDWRDKRNEPILPFAKDVASFLNQKRAELNEPITTILERQSIQSEIDSVDETIDLVLKEKDENLIKLDKSIERAKMVEEENGLRKQCWSHLLELKYEPALELQTRGCSLAARSFFTESIATKEKDKATYVSDQERRVEKLKTERQALQDKLEAL